jgi:transposase
MSAALCYQPDASGARLVFGAKGGAYRDTDLIDFLNDLHHELGATKITLLWDGLPGHRSKTMRAFVACQRWLVVERLPAYAPELNPVEGLWGNLKGQELANLPTEDLLDAADAADEGIYRLSEDDALLFAFLRHTGLLL